MRNTLVAGLGLVAAVRAVGRPVTVDQTGGPVPGDAHLLDRLEEELDRMG